MKTLFICIVLALSGCHGSRVPVDPDRYEIQRGSGWSYQRSDDGQVIVWAYNHELLETVLTEIGCGSEYICQVGQMGNVFQVIQRRK